MGELENNDTSSPTSKGEHPKLATSNVVEVYEDLTSVATRYVLPEIALEENNPASFVIIGFDTEYQPLLEITTLEDVKSKKAKYDVLSYQFYAINHLGQEWSGIAIPEYRRRIALTDFVAYALAKGAKERKAISPTVVLVGHFNKADLPAFADRKNLFFHFRNVRNSLVTLGHPVPVAIDFEDGGTQKTIKIQLRDTMLLAPAKSKSLAKLGDLIGLSKFKLTDDPELEHEWKESMRDVRDNDWELFRDYAIRDAEVCAKYFLRVKSQYKAVTGKDRMPTALSTIGMTLLLEDWDKRGIDHNRVLGRELIEEVVYSEKHDQFVMKRTRPYLQDIALFEQLATECYHGGRNEQMWFGPSFVDGWIDYDLAGAYPTAMAMIGLPEWTKARATTELTDLASDVLSYALVKFKFPADLRYPTLPVRSHNGIIFPLEGESYCCAPELKLALSLGCTIEVRHGLVIPIDNSQQPFFNFIKDSIAKRNGAADKIGQEFWKEATNSCYGKTAQGLRAKRTYNLKDKATERTHPSEITNPFYAAHITSVVRAVVGEIMNALPDDAMVFSVTTDGLITNVAPEVFQTILLGQHARAFSRTRHLLTGDDTVCEKKHAMRQILGWRTRGQATIQKDGDKFVLARAGIKPPISCEDDDERNYYILQTFFNRSAETVIELDIPTSFREIVEYDVDMVMKKTSRRVSMEYDLKRKPFAVGETQASIPDVYHPEKVDRYNHVAFSTVPWRNVSEFSAARRSRDDYWRKKARCIKTKSDYIDFADHYDSLQALGTKKARYLRKNKGPLKRLVRDLCRAFKQGEAGLENAYLMLTAREFAQILNDAGLRDFGINVTRSDVENGKRSAFQPAATPPTAEVLSILARLEALLPGLDRTALLSSPAQRGVQLLPAVDRRCPFIDRLQ